MKLKKTALTFEEKLSRIKIVALDLDGILTDAYVWWESEEVGFNRAFNIYDGYGMRILMKSGLKVGVITGGNSISVEKRVEQLGLDFCYAGQEDKREAFLDILKRYHVSSDEVLYMGDELFDIPLLKKAGFSATVPNTSEEVQSVVDYVTQKESGKGCVREVIDMIRYVQEIPVLHEDF